MELESLATLCLAVLHKDFTVNLDTESISNLLNKEPIWLAIIFANQCNIYGNGKILDEFISKILS